MRILNKLLFILPLICVITSCGDTELEAPEIIPSEPSVISFWEEQSHLVMMGWKGKVNAVKESSYIVPFERQSKDEEAVSSSEWKFDISGHLIYYNPTSIEPTIYARDVWQVMACYSYGYDKAGKMVKVIVNDFSGDPVIYTLTYGEHEVFVPLIFPLGIYDFFLVKGLESISDADGSVLYTYSGNKAIYTTESWSGVTSTTFEYDEGVMYPVRKIVTLKRGGVIANMEITSYLYNEDGSLASSDKIVKEGENEVERTVVRYMASTLLPVSKLTDAGGQLDWTYKYDDNNWWTEITYKEHFEEEAEAKELSIYTRKDAFGNWTEAVQQQNNMVDWSHPDSSVKVNRIISYYLVHFSEVIMIEILPATFCWWAFSFNLIQIVRSLSLSA